jgi:hypothetical protein
VFRGNRQTFASPKPISDEKQRAAEDGARQIEIVTDAVLVAPTHPRKPMKGFTDVSQNDHHQTSGTEQLQKRRDAYFSRKYCDRIREEHGDGHERNQGFD